MKKAEDHDKFVQNLFITRYHQIDFLVQEMLQIATPDGTIHLESKPDQLLCLLFLTLAFGDADFGFNSSDIGPLGHPFWAMLILALCSSDIGPLGLAFWAMLILALVSSDIGPLGLPIWAILILASCSSDVSPLGLPFLAKLILAYN